MNSFYGFTYVQGVDVVDLIAVEALHSCSAMEKQSDITKDFFELIADLNHGNKIKNEKTQGRFTVSLNKDDFGSKLFYELNNSSKALLLYSDMNNVWFSYQPEKYGSLKKHIILVLKSYKEEQNLDDYIKSKIFLF